MGIDTPILQFFFAFFFLAFLLFYIRIRAAMTQKHSKNSFITSQIHNKIAEHGTESLLGCFRFSQKFSKWRGSGVKWGKIIRIRAGPWVLPLDLISLLRPFNIDDPTTYNILKLHETEWYFMPSQGYIYTRLRQNISHILELLPNNPKIPSLPLLR